MQITRSGKTLLVHGPAGPEQHRFGSAAEAQGRLAFIAEALTWIGTPFIDHADVKGPRGAVDCAMLLTRCAVDTGIVPPFDPRPYSPQWHQHAHEELFVNFLTDRLGAKEITTPRPGDVLVWQFGHTFSHGAVLVNSGEVVHAWAQYGKVARTRRDEPVLARMQVFGTAKPRPVRYFDLWSTRR
jgi:cell wall-associated NlpC family hydrolase